MFVHSIRNQDEIFSSAQDNKSGFISIEDVAEAAYDALVAEKSQNTDFYMVGPELYTHDEVSVFPRE